jgi:hypothetical protein
MDRPMRSPQEKLLLFAAFAVVGRAPHPSTIGVRRETPRPYRHLCCTRLLQRYCGERRSPSRKVHAHVRDGAGHTKSLDLATSCACRELLSSAGDDLLPELGSS